MILEKGRTWARAMELAGVAVRAVDQVVDRVVDWAVEGDVDGIKGELLDRVVFVYVPNVAKKFRTSRE
jgi:hypothetical protein